METRRLLSGWLALAMLAGCGAEAAAQIESANENEPAEATEDLQADGSALAGDTFAFAADLYKALGGSPGNVVFSPQSVAMALGMVTLGAGGDTADQLRRVLHWNHGPISTLPARLAAWRDGLAQTGGGGTQLSMANAVWGAPDLRPSSLYANNLQQGFGSPWQTLDPASAPQQINSWVANQTDGAISELVRPGQLDPRTRMVATSALYMAAPWQTPFSPQGVRQKTFYSVDGATPQVAMLTQNAPMQYAETAAFQAVDLPYVGGRLRFTVLLPTGGLTAGAPTLSAANVQEALNAFHPAQVKLSLPKFKVGVSYSLKDTLEVLGVQDAFAPGRADFSAIDGASSLALGDVLHQTVVDVNEAGTLATAATAVGMRPTALPAATATVEVNRPFVFLIRDSGSGTLLFFGRVDHL